MGELVQLVIPSLRLLVQLLACLWTIWDQKFSRKHSATPGDRRVMFVLDYYRIPSVFKYKSRLIFFSKLRSLKLMNYHLFCCDLFYRNIEFKHDLFPLYKFFE